MTRLVKTNHNNGKDKCLKYDEYYYCFVIIENDHYLGNALMFFGVDPVCNAL